MQRDQETQPSSWSLEKQRAEEQGIVPAAKPHIDGKALARRIEDAQTLPQKAELLWSLPTLERHAALGALSADLVAAMIEMDPESNTAMLGNMPAPKFGEIVNLGAPEQGRRWLERAVGSKLMAAQMLPALLPPRDLMLMLMTSREYRNALNGLLNFRRAEQMRTLLHPLEWKNSLDDLLLADAEELLKRSPIKDRNIRTILQSLIDFFPELYLDVIRKSLDYAKYQEDRGEELADILDMPFAMPEMLNETPSAPASSMAVAPSKDLNNNGIDPSITELIPASNDAFMQMATSRLPVDRRDQLEAELKDLLRREILANASFSQADLLRASGRMLFQLRAGLLQVGADTPEAASQALLTRSFTDIVALGARATERYRQRALQLSGVKDWLDRAQRQFLASMNTLEPGVNPETGAPALYLSARPNQHREDWQPTLLSDVDSRLDEIAAWSGLARAAFGSPSRVQSIFASLKTKTAMEAVRRTVIALCLYRRWEPELVNPGEDFVLFRKQFADELGRLNAARQVVLDALDATAPDAWKPHDAKQRARDLMLYVIDVMENQRSAKPQKAKAGVEEDEDREVEED